MCSPADRLFLKIVRRCGRSDESLYLGHDLVPSVYDAICCMVFELNTVRTGGSPIGHLNPLPSLPAARS